MSKFSKGQSSRKKHIPSSSYSYFLLLRKRHPGPFRTKLWTLEGFVSAKFLPSQKVTTVWRAVMLITLLPKPVRARFCEGLCTARMNGIQIKGVSGSLREREGIV